MKLPSKKGVITIVAIVLVSMLIAAVVYAAINYTMTSPSSDPVTVTEPALATLSKVTTDKSSLVIGESLTLSTIVSDGIVGLNVTFLNNNSVAVGSGLTDSSGIASCTIYPSTVGTKTYHATATHP